MEKRLGRELLWLSLPVALIGGVAFYQTRGGPLPRLSLSNPFDPGPLRLDYSSFQPIAITPLDVANGFDWAARTNVYEAGTLNAPSTWRDDGLGNRGMTRDLRAVYRIGTQWKTAPEPTKGAALFNKVLGSDNLTFKVNLRTVPRQAEEVRLRGKFSFLHLYRGPLPLGWKPPKNLQMTNAGLNHFVTVESKPFDVAIKGEGEPWPDTQVSHEQKIEAVEGKWLRDQIGERIMVRFRAKPDSGIPGDLKCSVDHLRYFDANGKPLRVFQDAKSTVDAGIQGSMREWVSPDLPKSEEVILLSQPDAQPRGGWGQVKMPVSISGTVSDGSCWPTPFRVQMAPETGETKSYGAPK